MKTVTFTELRNNASTLFSLVEQGETLQVVRHGRPIARVVPTNSADAVPSWKRPGLRLVASGAALATAVLEERETAP